MTLKINILPAIGGMVHIQASVGTDQVFAAEVESSLAQPILEQVIRSISKRALGALETAEEDVR